MIMLKEQADMKVFSEEEAKNLLEKFKVKAIEEGFEIVKSSITLKEKKQKGEVIDSWYVVSITKRWND